MQNIFTRALTAAVLLSAAAAALPARADTIFFKNGMRLDIRKAWAENGQVMCEMYGSTVSYPADEVDRIEKVDQGKGAEGENEVRRSEAGAGEDQKSVDPPVSGVTAREYHLRAEAMADRKAWRDAFDCESRACELEPDRDACRDSLSEYALQYADWLMSRGRQRRAVSALQSGLERVPGHAALREALNRAYAAMGYQYLEKQRYAECRKLLREMKGFDRGNPHIYVLEGDIAYQEGKYGKARESWSTALELDAGLVGVNERLKKIELDKNAEEHLRETGTGQFTIIYDAEKNREMAEEIKAVLEGAYRDVGRELDFYPGDSIPVMVYPKSDLITLDYFPDWAAGIYDGKIRLGEDLWETRLFFKATLYHEYTHVLVRMLGGANVPLWLNEGLAEYSARRFKKPSERGFRKRLILEALSQKRLFSIRQISLLNPAFLSRLPPLMITLAYAQSEAFTAYLIREYSMVEIREVVRRLGTGRGLRETILMVLTEDLEVLEQRWREGLLKE